MLTKTAGSSPAVFVLMLQHLFLTYQLFLMVVTGMVPIRILMRMAVPIVVVFVQGFPVTFAGDFDIVSGANVFQVAFPSAGCGDIQNEAVIVRVV